MQQHSKTDDFERADMFCNRSSHIGDANTIKKQIDQKLMNILSNVLGCAVCDNYPLGQVSFTTIGIDCDLEKNQSIILNRKVIVKRALKTPIQTYIFCRLA